MTMWLFSKETMGFYHRGVNPVYPADCVQISAEQRNALFAEMARGRVLCVDSSGLPATREKELTVLQVVNGLQLRVNSIYQQRMASIADVYPVHERESWPVQLEEAKALQADLQAATPWLDACAAARGLDKAVLADRVLQKDAAYRLISGQLSGIRQRHEDAIAQLQTVEEANSYDVNAYWPEQTE